MRFDDIAGAAPVKRYLPKLVGSNRLPHALLFDVREGTGGLALALAFAQFLACKQPLESDSCGQCPRCVRMAKGTLSDIHLVLPEPGADKVGPESLIEEQKATLQNLLSTSIYFTEQQWYAARKQAGKQGIISAKTADFLLEQLAYRPYELPFRIVIIWLPERLNAASANRLLKIVEEPPMGAKFLFVSENTADILPTILSRLQRIAVPPLSAEEIANSLTEQHNISPDQAKLTAHLAMGSFAKALDIINSDGHDEDLELFKQLTQAAYRNAYLELAEWAAKTSKVDREALKALVEYLASLFRSGFMINIGHPELSYATPAETEFLENFAPYINGRNVGYILYELSMLIEHIQRNGNARILLTDFAFRMANRIGANIV